MPAPTRFTSGLTQAAPFQPFGNIGVSNPLYYHQLVDDFDDFVTGKWTVAGTATPVTAIAAGNGGIFSMATKVLTPAAGDNAQIQKSVGSFLIAGANAVTDAGTSPKTLFMTSIASAAIATTSFVVGLTNAATVFGATNVISTITDGVFLVKTATQPLALYVIAASGTPVIVPIPTAAYTLTNSVYLDLAISVTSGGDVTASVGTGLVGRVVQSGSGANTPARLAPVVRATAPTLPTAVLLTPTVAVQAATAAQATLLVDYVFAGTER